MKTSHETIAKLDMRVKSDKKKWQCYATVWPGLLLFASVFSLSQSFWMINVDKSEESKARGKERKIIKVREVDKEMNLEMQKEINRDRS